MRGTQIWTDVDQCNLEQTWEDAQSNTECQSVESHCGHGMHSRERTQIWAKKDGMDKDGNVVRQGVECDNERGPVVAGIQTEISECSAGHYNGNCRKCFSLC